MDERTWRVPGYSVESLLGAGGSGTVWRARSRRSGEQVALKHLPIGSATAPDQATAEAALLTALSHPHLIGLREVLRLDDAVVLVLDLASRGSLAALLTSRGRLTAGETITAVAPVAAAVAYAHANHVVHGDISPANIVFSERGDALLTDLGLARLTGARHPGTGTGSGAAGGAGTPGYADPAAGVLPVESGDVWSLGAVAFHCLTGGVPRGDLGAGLSGAPDAVAEVVLRALDPDPSQRGTAADFALDLRHAATPTAVEFDAGREPAPPRPAPTRAVAVPPRHEVRRTRRIPRWAWAVVVATLVLGIGGAVAAGLAGRSAAGREALPASSPASGTYPRSSPPSAGPGVTSQAPPRPAAEAVGTILAELDAVRERAYGRRQPDLLAEVYAPGELLTRDRAQLLAQIPAGCVLAGVRTAYSDVVIAARTPTRVEVRATAELQRATLTCGGGVRGTTPETTAGLRITLIRSPAGWLIQTIS